MNKASCIFEIIDSTINDSDDHLTVTEMCKIAGVSRSGYYNWKNSAEIRAAKEEQDQKDFELILTAYKKRSYSKGAKGIYMCLLHMEPPVIMNLKKIRRLMKKYNLICPIRKANPYRRMAKALKTSNTAENLLSREFECYGPRAVLLTDITYIPYNGTFAYLSTIIDAYTKQILSYVLSSSLQIDFVLETINILIKEHGIALKEETLVHSDQGCHYTSYAFIDILKNNKLRQSMSRKANCWDNAPQESFFGHMKDHIGKTVTECTEFEQVKEIIDDYMDYYNNDRYQWHLAKLSPNEFYQFYITGEYPIRVNNPPPRPLAMKDISDLGKNKSPDVKIDIVIEN